MLAGATSLTLALFVTQTIVEQLCHIYVICAPFNWIKCVYRTFLVETLMLRNNLLNFDPAYASLSVSEMEDIINLICTH